MVRLSDEAILAKLPTRIQLQAELLQCQNELHDIIAERDTAGSFVCQRRTVAVQELLEARNDLALVYANIQDDIERVGGEVADLRRLVNALSASDEGGPNESSRHQDFSHVRVMIEAAQAALSSLEQRQREVFTRISALQVLLAQQSTLENVFERHRIQRVLALEQTVKDIVSKIQLRASVGGSDASRP